MPLTFNNGRPIMFQVCAYAYWVRISYNFEYRFGSMQDTFNTELGSSTIITLLARPSWLWTAGRFWLQIRNHFWGRVEAVRCMWGNTGSSAVLVVRSERVSRYSSWPRILRRLRICNQNRSRSPFNKLLLKELIWSNEPSSGIQWK